MEAHPDQCLNCGEKLTGRKGKKYCNPRCKASHHNHLNQDKPPSFFVRVDRALKHNRRVLKHFNQGGLTTIRREALLAEGFDPNFFTHYWKNSREEVYFFCYEFGFRPVARQGQQKYLLVHWQPYMEKD